MTASFCLLMTGIIAGKICFYDYFNIFQFILIEFSIFIYKFAYNRDRSMNLNKFLSKSRIINYVYYLIYF